MCFREMESCLANMQHLHFTVGHCIAVGPTGLRAGVGEDETLSNILEGVWNAMQAWQ